MNQRQYSHLRVFESPRHGHAVPHIHVCFVCPGIDTTEAGSYFNNVAVAVRAAQHAGARRVMVIDW